MASQPALVKIAAAATTAVLLAVSNSARLQCISTPWNNPKEFCQRFFSSLLKDACKMSFRSPAVFAGLRNLLCFQ